MDSGLCIESPGENGGFAGMKVCHGLGSMQVCLYLIYFPYTNATIQQYDNISLYPRVQFIDDVVHKGYGAKKWYKLH